jgi:hypothetical protein
MLEMVYVRLGLLLVWLSVALASCGDFATGPSIAANSPEAAVKSWWRLRDASLAYRLRLCNEGQDRDPLLHSVGDIATGDVAKYARSDCSFVFDTFDRKIESVAMPSGTNATVVATVRNNSALPKDAALTNAERRARQTGAQFVYVLQRNTARDPWKIAQVFSKAPISEEMEPMYEAARNSHAYAYLGY